MKTILSGCLLSTGLLLVGPAWAEPEDVGLTTEVPTRTAAWLELQRSGQQGSPNQQLISGAEYDKTLERFMKTYDFPIPPKLSTGDGFKAD